MNAGVNIEVVDKRTGKVKKYNNKGGLSSYIKYLGGRKQNISEIFHCEGKQDGLSVENICNGMTPTPKTFYVIQITFHKKMVAHTCLVLDQV